MERLGTDHQELQASYSGAMAIPGNRGMESLPTPNSAGASVPSSFPNRSFSSSHAEKRANHNAVERARRETLNIRFLELAHSIPSLVHVRKPTKSVIVSRSIEFIQDAKQRLEIFSRNMHSLRKQNEDLKVEVNRLRSELGRAPVMFADPVDMDMAVESAMAYSAPTGQPLQTMPDAQRIRSQPSPYTNIRTGSPFELVSHFDDDEDDFNMITSPAVARSFPQKVMQPMHGNTSSSIIFLK
jgi:hypothetical protein